MTTTTTPAAAAARETETETGQRRSRRRVADGAVWKYQRDSGVAVGSGVAMQAA